MGIRASFGGFDFEVRKNDTYPTFATVLTDGSSDGDGSIIDLSSPTTRIYLNIKRPDGNFKTVEAHKTGNKGEVYYQWKDGDLDITGIYEIEIRIIFDGGKKYTALERKRFKVLETITGV